MILRSIHHLIEVLKNPNDFKNKYTFDSSKKMNIKIFLNWEIEFEPIYMDQ